jgi:hypothetical protein
VSDYTSMGRMERETGLVRYSLYCPLTHRPFTLRRIALGGHGLVSSFSQFGILNPHDRRSFLGQGRSWVSVVSETSDVSSTAPSFHGPALDPQLFEDELPLSRASFSSRRLFISCPSFSSVSESCSFAARAQSSFQRRCLPDENLRVAGRARGADAVYTTA